MPRQNQKPHVSQGWLDLTERDPEPTVAGIRELRDPYKLTSELCRAKDGTAEIATAAVLRRAVGMFGNSAQWRGLAR